MRVSTSERLKQIMKERNIKQKDILEASLVYQKNLGIKLDKSNLSQYTNNKSVPDQNKLYLLAKTLNVSEGWLMGYPVPMERMDEKDKILEELYSSATPQQKANMQRRTLDDVKGWLGEDAYNLLMNYLDCNDKGKQLGNDRLLELVKLYPKK